MPNGLRHAFACGVVAGASASVLFFACGWQAALACSIGALAGIVLTPDLDLVSKNYKMARFWGVVVERLWFLAWTPYRVCIPHRSIWSHGPVISTLVRLLYLGVVPLGVWTWLGLPLPPVQAWMLWGLLGLVASDSCHWFLDVMDSKLGGRL